MQQISRKPILAIDLGGTKMLSAIVTPLGGILSRNYCLTMAERGKKAVIDTVISNVSGILSKAKLEIRDLDGIVVAAAGILDTIHGVVTVSPNLSGWRNVQLGEILFKNFGLTTFLINDANAAALGENRFGVGKGIDSLIYLTVSTGIGGGIIIGGKLYSGAYGCAGELGHMVIEDNGPKCSCGNNGCLEAMASGTAMAREVVDRIEKGEMSTVIQLVQGRLDKIDAKIVAMAAKKGDALACEVVNKIAYYLGIGFVNLVNIFNPEMIIIGGGVSRMGRMLLEPAKRVMKERAFKLPSRNVRIVRSRLGYDAGVLGAAAYFYDQHQQLNGVI